MTKHETSTATTDMPGPTLPAEDACLTGRISLWHIRNYCLQLKHDECLQNRIFLLLRHTNPRVADNAAWILTHLSPQELQWLIPHFNILTDMAMQTSDKTLQRLLLTLICRLPFPAQPHIALFNFCMTGMTSRQQPNGIRSLCMKLAYKTALAEPALLEEVRMTLEFMEPASLPPSLCSSRKNILSALRRKKELRT